MDIFTPISDKDLRERKIRKWKEIIEVVECKLVDKLVDDEKVVVVADFLEIFLNNSSGSGGMLYDYVSIKNYGTAIIDNLVCMINKRRMGFEDTSIR